MFLVVDRWLGVTHFVFTYDDPRSDGYQGEVSEGVSLDYDMLSISAWPDGAPRPDPCLGQDPRNANHYKVFKYPTDLHAAGFKLVHHGTPLVFGSWSDYRERLPLPRDLDEESWYEQQEQIDENARVRRERANGEVAPAGTGRDEVAGWVAKRHMLADTGIREIWYLPHSAPPEEIRLLEINDRFAGPETSITPIDFGLAVGDKEFQLLVADITSKQLEAVRRDPSLLPPGWDLAGGKAWGRRG